MSNKSSRIVLSGMDHPPMKTEDSIPRVCYMSMIYYIHIADTDKLEAQACLRLVWRQLAAAVEFGHFAGTEAPVPLTRAEGPAGNSPAREGGGLQDPESEGRRPGTATVPHLRRSFSKPAPFPGLTAGPTHCRPFGPGGSLLPPERRTTSYPCHAPSRVLQVKRWICLEEASFKRRCPERLSRLHWALTPVRRWRKRAN